LEQNLFNPLLIMKTKFTKLFSAALISALALSNMAVNAQTAPSNTDGTTASTTNTTTADTKAEAKEKKEAKAEVAAPAKAAEDTSWKPQRRVWGYTFGDLYYAAHTDQNTGARGPETNYAGVPTYRNAFQFRRIYLGYDYEITKKFKAEFLLASEPSANTNPATGTGIQNGDNLVDGKMALWIKNANLRVRDIWNGTDFVIGEMSTPGFALNEPGTNGPVSLSEATWAYRSIEKTITDFHKNNSYDVGAALQGTFDPKTKNFGYVFMVGNNSQASLLSAASANTGFYKIFYGDLWGKFLNQKLYVDLYADYVRTSAATAAIPGASHGMYKIFASYSMKPITLGVEAYTQNFTSGVINATTKAAENATAQGISIWARGPIVKNLNYFARYDSYNPFTDYNSATVYAPNTTYGNYTPLYKEKFYTAGLDFNPTKNVHFEPNVWLVDFTDQRASTTTGYVAPDHTLVFRFTFFFTFGK
jgi:hypothetical protein